MGWLIFLYSVICIYGIEAATITVSDKIINMTDDRFVSWTIDTSEIASGSHPRFNVSNPQVIYLAQQLAPSYLRMGGTQSDYTYYQVGDENPCQLPSSSYHCLKPEIFEQIIKFAEQVDAKFVFGLSIGYPTYPSANTLTWNSSNTQQFLQYLKNKGYDSSNLYGFELGNELNKDPYTTPDVQSKAFKQLRSIIDTIWGENNGIKLFGPDPHSYTLRENQADFNYITDFVEETCTILDGVTYHSYVDMNKTQLLTPYGLDEQYRESVRMSDIWNEKGMKNKSQHCQGLLNNIWAGEIAEHNNGGITNVTNTYYDGFWYLDALGTISNLGHAVFARQSFAAVGTYSLLSSDYVPNCDYYTAFLFNKLMSNKVIEVESDDENLRIYAHCKNNATNNGVSMSYININKDDAQIKYDGSILNDENVYLYSLTPSDKDQGLESKSMLLNGKLLSLDENGKLPSLDGKKIEPGTDITVPGYSYGFLTFDSSKISVCN